MNKKLIIYTLVLFTIVISMLLLLNYGKNIVVRFYLEKTIKSTIDLRFAIEECSVSILNTDARIKNLTIFNPKEFKDKLMIDIAEIYIDFDTYALLKGKPYLRDLRINVDEIAIFKNKEGKLNLESLAVVKASEQEKNAAEISGVAIPAIRIDSFELKVKKVSYKDYSQALLPMIIEKDINVNERFENIENLSLVVRLILVEAIKKAAIEQLLTINLQALSRPINGIINSVRNISKGAAKIIQKTGNQKETANTVADSLKPKLPEQQPAGETLPAKETQINDTKSE